VTYAQCQREIEVAKRGAANQMRLGNVVKAAQEQARARRLTKRLRTLEH